MTRRWRPSVRGPGGPTGPPAPYTRPWWWEPPARFPAAAGAPPAAAPTCDPPAERGRAAGRRDRAALRASLVGA
jgi:hypothetical protein